ncbi:hypothetical protein LGN09_05155 [Burkholderia cenocepacia]|uniref:hypothetical protein n=1 Tax=Burkholderia cepacia complex TaxID=87882 RepID=UPI001CF3FAD9|nr:hypothetical protein [Burkholderia cenocepacia]MCA8404264.1 hypothetical protein [Burkholderia cenocepacia]
MSDRRVRLQRSAADLRKPVVYFFPPHAAVMITRRPRRAAGATTTQGRDGRADEAVIHTICRLAARAAGRQIFHPILHSAERPVSAYVFPHHAIDTGHLAESSCAIPDERMIVVREAGSTPSNPEP